jgi:tRNA-2-methylthio-N6-dimethylallyladenosine synthase
MKLYVQTYGCQMNQLDSARIVQLMKSADYEPTEHVDDADLIILNTCSVRDKAEQKVYSALGRWRKLKEEKGVILGVGGCVAQQEGEALLRRAPHLDLVFGTHNMHKLPQMVEEAREAARRSVETAFYRDPFYLEDPLGLPETDGAKAYVTIMQGCNKVCSFCIVPRVRGREVSRASENIVRDVEELVRRGVKEVMLLGQNVNSYGRTVEGERSFPELLERLNDVPGIRRIRFTTSHPQDLSPELVEAFVRLENLCEHLHVRDVEELVRRGVKEVMLLGQNVNSYGRTVEGERSFPELLERINDIPGIRRIRFTTSHPQDLSPELVDAFVRLENLCEHLHLPLQSGSDAVLERMRRGYRLDEYMGRINELRRRRPEVAISTDMIVGFPGETEAEFEETLSIVREIEYDDMFTFTYSPRPRTVAAKVYEDDVPDEVKGDRCRRLQELQKSIALRKNRSLIGAEQEVLVEGPSRLGRDQLMGRTRTNRIVNFVPNEATVPAEMARVRVLNATPNSLVGEAMAREVMQ